MTWTELETSTYQHHVIQHVIGATVLGWFVAEDAAHFALDVGLLWTIYVNGEMNLMALFVAIEDLEGEELPKVVIEELTDDAQKLIRDGREATDLKHFVAAPVDCLIREVHVLSSESLRWIKVIGENASLEIRTSIGDSSLSVSELGEINA